MQIANKCIPRFIILTYFAELGFMLQVNLFKINIFWHQFIQNMTTDFVWIMRIFINCSKIQNLQNMCFWISEKFMKILINQTKSVVIFWINWCQNMLIWQRITCSMKPSSAKYVGIMYLGMHLQFAQFINSYQHLQ